MSEVGFLNGLELPEPKLPDVFDYDASVTRLQDLRDKTGEGFKKLMQELWIARECLAVVTGRPRKVQSKGPKVRSWMEYLEAVGLARSTVHKWLTSFFPDKERKITLPTKPAPKLPLKPSTSGQVPPPKDQALGNAMDKTDWGGGEDPESRDGTRSHIENGNENETPPSPARLNADICVQLTYLRVKVSAHVDAAKIQAAQKLLSELFMLFSAE